jgi:hypothetical protein
MGAPPTVGSLEALAARSRGRWWFADEDDNPFGLVMLVAPSQKKNLLQPRMELYTLDEARMKMKRPWRDCSKIYAEPARSEILLRFGWNLFYGDRQLEANLPLRFTPEGIKEFFRDADALRRSLFNAQHTLTRFSNWFKRKSAMERALVEWREQLERKRKGVNCEEDHRENASGEN